MYRKKGKKQKNKKENNFSSYRRICYVCGGKLVKKTIQYENRKWGSEEKFIENVEALVCERCSEPVFTPETVKELQELSRSY